MGPLALLHTLSKAAFFRGRVLCAGRGGGNFSWRLVRGVPVQFSFALPGQARVDVEGDSRGDSSVFVEAGKQGARRDGCHWGEGHHRHDWCL